MKENVRSGGSRGHPSGLYEACFKGGAFPATRSAVWDLFPAGIDVVDERGL
jgi:hypothetical protein